MSETLMDVVAVNMQTMKVRVMKRGVDEENADAVIAFAVMRRGVDEEFFASAAANKYENGDTWASDD